MRKSPLKNAITEVVLNKCINKAPKVKDAAREVWAIHLYDTVMEPWIFYRFLQDYVEQEDGKR